MKSDHLNILLADDDPDAQLLVREALQETRSPHQLTCVGDGEQLLDYLRHRGAYAEVSDHPHSYLILLDLNMPRKDGRETLREIKDDPHLRRIPVIILTTSQDKEDIANTYDSGASSFIIKPRDFETLLKLIQSINRYWFEIVRLPPSEN